MAMFRIVGGTDLTPEKSQTEPRRDLAASGRISFRAPDDAETLTITNRNKRLREQRYDVWRKAAAATCYWLMRTYITRYRSGRTMEFPRLPVTRQRPKIIDGPCWKTIGKPRSSSCSLLPDRRIGEMEARRFR